MKENEIIEILRKENQEFKKIEEEHRSLDEKICAMDKTRYLSPEKELERKSLQKKKLAKKDQMAVLVRDYKQSHTN